MPNISEQEYDALVLFKYNNNITSVDCNADDFLVRTWTTYTFLSITSPVTLHLWR